MFKATNIQTKEVRTGTEQEILNLDQRIWTDKQEISDVPKSHHVPLWTEHLVYELFNNVVGRISRQGYHLPYHGFKHSISFGNHDFMKAEYGKSL